MERPYFKDNTIYLPSIDSPTLDAIRKSIKDMSVNVVISEDGSKVIDKADSIEWSYGLWYNGRFINTDKRTYKYSMPIKVSQGDIISVKLGNGLASSYVGLFKTNENGTYYWESQNYHPSNFLVYVARQDEYIMIQGRVDNGMEVHWYASSIYDNTLYLVENVASLFPRVEYQPLLAMMRRANGTGDTPKGVRPLMLLHYSDMHNNGQCLNRLKAFKDMYSSYLDDVISTGDMVASKYANPYSYYDNDGFNKFLQVIGNHDVYDAEDVATSGYDNVAYFATPQQKYERYMSNIALWGVTQPSGAGENDYYPCYYYKDYNISGSSATGYIRLICLDCMEREYDATLWATQLAWFESVLADAKTKGYPVIVADHFPPVISSNDVEPFDTAFHSFTDTMPSVNYSARISGATNAVDSFIDEGGEFVCWLCGHLHYDQVGVLKSHPNQIYIAVGSGNASAVHLDCDRSAEFYTKDLFNIVGVDTANKVIKVLRVGADFDKWMRHRKTMSIKYDTRELLSTY